MIWPLGRTRSPDRTTADTGRAAERAAERFLKRHGHRILARNVAYPGGEVDLVAFDKAARTVCFVEVRSRRAPDDRPPDVQPQETVTRAKRRRIIGAARRFLAERRAADARVRFDVVAVLFAGDDLRHADIRHFPAAFQADAR